MKQVGNCAFGRPLHKDERDNGELSPFFRFSVMAYSTSVAKKFSSIKLGVAKKTAAQDSVNPFKIARSKLVPAGIASSSSQGSKPNKSSVALNFRTNGLSKPLWLSKILIGAQDLKQVHDATLRRATQNSSSRPSGSRKTTPSRGRNMKWFSSRVRTASLFVALMELAPIKASSSSPIPVEWKLPAFPV